MDRKTRPTLKGISHLIAFIVYIAKFSRLSQIIPREIRVPLNLYLIIEQCHFGCSTLLHIVDWPEKQEIHIRRLDHIVIFLKIVSTYYAISSTILTDIHPLVLFAVLTGCTLGILSRIFFTEAPKYIIALPYFLTSCAILLDIHSIISFFRRTSLGAVLCLAGAVFYFIGGYVYIKRSPNLFPRYFEYHELFHILSIIGTSMYTIFFFSIAIPYYQSRAM